MTLTSIDLSTAPTTHEGILAFVREVAELTQPDAIHWCTGSDEEWTMLTEALEGTGTFTRLDPAKKPNSFYAASDPIDVARVEDRTYICSVDEKDCGPTNNWMDPEQMKGIMRGLYEGCMRGRTMFVIPFVMGHLEAERPMFGVELTDSAYVTVSMRVMARMGSAVLDKMTETDAGFVQAIHSVGHPLADGEADVAWPCNDTKYIVQFPEERAIWSFGSGYGGNALLGKKCLALRIASTIAKKNGWMAEHMLILGLESPDGEKRYVTAAFPSACGKTNLAMLVPPAGYEGWKVTTVGDDIAWLWPHADGKLHAINPEAGYFGVAPGTSYETNPNAMDSLKENAIFTNVALTDDGDIWWEEMTEEAPAHLIDWKGNDWTPDSETPSSHPNARFTAPASQCPVIDPEWQNPDGVPIDAFVFGGRRASTMPLVFQANSWNHGIFIGSVMGSEMTAAAAGGAGQVRRDPMAMLPFIGYHVGDYLQQWVDIASKVEKLPAVFHVNWFRKSPEGTWLWPGFGENMRVLEWILARTDGKVEGEEKFVGTVPKFGELNLDGLDFSEDDWNTLMALIPEEWQNELATQEEFLNKVGDKLPQAIKDERAALIERVG